MPFNQNLEKSALKLEKRRESAIILEKGLFKKLYLNVANTRNASCANLWLRGIYPLKINGLRRYMVLIRQSLFLFAYPTRLDQHRTANLSYQRMPRGGNRKDTSPEYLNLY